MIFDNLINGCFKNLSKNQEAVAQPYYLIPNELI